MTLLRKLQAKEPIASIFEEIDRTENFSGCLIEAIRNYPTEPLLIEMLKAFTVDHTDCLRYALCSEYYDPELIEYLFPLTENFRCCLRNAIFYRPGDKALMERLTPLTEDFTDCLLYASTRIDDEEYLLFLAGKTEKFEKVIKECKYNNKNLLRIYNVITRTTFLPNADFGESLRYAISADSYHRPLIDFLLPRTKVFNYCLRNTLFYCPWEQDLIDHFTPLTRDFDGCLYFSTKILANPDTLVESFVSHTKDFSGCFKLCLEHRPLATSILVKLLPNTPSTTCLLAIALSAPGVDSQIIDDLVRKESKWEGCLRLAIINYPGNCSLVETIFEKCGKAKVGGVSATKGAWLTKQQQDRMLLPLSQNEDCFVCMEPLGNEELHDLDCGHQIHEYCNVTKFVCRLH